MLKRIVERMTCQEQMDAARVLATDFEGAQTRRNVQPRRSSKAAGSRMGC